MIIFSLLYLSTLLLLIVIGVWAARGGLFISAIAMAALVAPSFMHVSDVVNRDTAYEVIAEHAKYVDDLERQMKKLPSISSGLMNADTPYASISSQLTAAKAGLMKAKLEKIGYTRSIAKRKAGFTQYVTWFY